MMDMYEFYPNRTICEVLEAMRKAHETRNYSYLPALIEEAQYMANRMESGLADIKSLEVLREEKSKVKAELKALSKKLPKKKKKRDAP